MSRRIEVELTSERPDGSWTWRAAGAREPKGELDGTLLPAGSKVGDVLKAEAEFDTGMAINFDGTHWVLDACRKLPKPIKVLFTSSIAAYGGDIPIPVQDDINLLPQTSYGTQKVIGELLVNDYSRKGFIDGRSLRLPTVVVRPGRPNRADAR